MDKWVVAVGAVLVVAAVSGAGVVVFQRHEHAGLVAKAQQACAGRDQPAAGAPAQLPLSLPMATGARVLSVAQQGRTVVAFARVPGSRSDIVTVRDAVLADLQGAGYRTTGTDQEPGYEAEAQVDGPYEGTVKVSPLCTGLLEVRYKIDT